MGRPDKHFLMDLLLFWKQRFWICVQFDLYLTQFVHYYYCDFSLYILSLFKNQKILLEQKQCFDIFSVLVKLFSINI